MVWEFWTKQLDEEELVENGEFVEELCLFVALAFLFLYRLIKSESFPFTLS